MPTREIFWNIGHYGYILYYLLIPLALILAYAIYRRYRLWRLGKPDNRLTDLWKSLWAFVVTGIVDGLIHRRFLRDLYPGLIHFLIFWGAIVFLLAAAIDFITHYAIGGLAGAPYLGVSLVVDAFGIIVLLGVIIAAYRRYIQRPDRLDNKPQDAIALALIFLIVLTGFIIEGLRIAALDPHWAAWSPGGWVVAQIFGGLSQGALLTTHAAFWWFHISLGLGAIVYVALTFSSLAHIVVAPFNVLFRSSRPKGALVPIDLEETETFGVAKISDFTWKQLFDLDSCTRCGRCQDVCPAYLSGKPLSPKKLIQNLKTHWLEAGPGLLAKGGNGDNPDISLIGDIITEDEIWACTTCRACQEVCPVFVEHIDKIVNLRRNLVLEQAEIPETAEGMLRCIEDRGHSCRGTTATRLDWCDGLDVKLLSEDKDLDVLYWVGCAAALEDRNMKVSAAFAKVLKAAGVNFGILGEEESCCGEPARRLGNEYLFQMQALKNIELLKGYGVKKIVTACPHCFNTLKNEYPQFGGEFEVVHHSEFIADLLSNGRLKPIMRLNKKVTYQDPCYLIRHNDIYEAPRKMLTSIPMLKFTEMERERDIFNILRDILLSILVRGKENGFHYISSEWYLEETMRGRATQWIKERIRDSIFHALPVQELTKYERKKKSFCCGGGGGRMWMEERIGTRINEMRTDQAIATKANVLATACPYCLQMFEDGIKAKEATEYLKAMDLAELVESAILYSR